MTSTTRVVLISDVRLYREGLERILARDGRLEVLSIASNVSSALQSLCDLRPEVVLIDVGMPRALASIRKFRAAPSRPAVVALGVGPSAEDAVGCAEAGASGFVGRDGTIEDLVRTVESAVRGELLCSRRIAGALMRRVARLAARPRPQAETSPLTPRELEIVALINEGLTNKEIGSRLHLELTTVKNHVHNILSKLGVHTRGEAAARFRSADPLGGLAPDRRPLH